MMLSVEIVDNDILQVHIAGTVGAEEWKAYKDMLIERLDASEKPIYVLTDLSDIDNVDKSIVSEFGQAPHLTHPNLGFLVLLGGNAFQQFITKVTEGNALRLKRAEKLRVHYDREAAIEWLKSRRAMDETRNSSL
jgi:anti-anti-sigma regulatory factor